jgi:3-isopropylmalate/(R)-2-methylmalate dehydratase small subunit
MDSKVTKISGTAIPLVGNDIDTDRIIPARYLKAVTFDGLGEHVFADDRSQLQGQHPFDMPIYQGAKVLLVNSNFGCGSSREHAPQSIAKWGIQIIVGESFSEIFFGNCVMLGIPCLTVSPETASRLQLMVQENPQASVTVDLVTQQVSCGDFADSININEGARQQFIAGTWDACGQLVANEAKIKEVADQLPYLKFI